VPVISFLGGNEITGTACFKTYFWAWYPCSL
jgi:hypothetical protein